MFSDIQVAIVERGGSQRARSERIGGGERFPVVLNSRGRGMAKMAATLLAAVMCGAGRHHRDYSLL